MSDTDSPLLPIPSFHNHLLTSLHLLTLVLVLHDMTFLVLIPRLAITTIFLAPKVYKVVGRPLTLPNQRSRSTTPRTTPPPYSAPPPNSGLEPSTTQSGSSVSGRGPRLDWNLRPVMLAIFVTNITALATHLLFRRPTIQGPPIGYVSGTVMTIFLPDVRWPWTHRAVLDIVVMILQLILFCAVFGFAEAGCLNSSEEDMDEGEEGAPVDESVEDVILSGRLMLFRLNVIESLRFAWNSHLGPSRRSDMESGTSEDEGENTPETGGAARLGNDAISSLTVNFL